MPCARQIPAAPSRIATLIAGLEVRPTEREAAARLPAILRRPDLFGDDEPPVPPEGYGRRLLHTDPTGRFSVWAMAWAPGASSPVHDHACWCAFGLYRGRLVDERFRLDAGLRPVGRRTCGPGDADALPAGPDGIHRMCNPGETPALSIHVYGFDPALRASSLGRSYAA